ncbi:dUTP diphosphatase [Natroniella acetigena]|uniref:dUTP diphosphatase n=1 Tax=Natroniella acetigena TaxID=52004 RepID=UPI00200A2E27|nr:dUTP diphosphatase [Natroniella acetigena]MCK8826253.1 dUTP diphosphatase [Natroniella acetigena]
MKIKIKRLDKSLPLPNYQHLGEDAGMDLYSREAGVLESGEYRLFKTGIVISLPRGYAGFVNPRSGLALKHGVTVLNADGVIDSGYRGEIGVVLINHGPEEFKVDKGDRIAQLIVQQYQEVEWEEVEQLDDSKRGSGGYGHTGV